MLLGQQQAKAKKELHQIPLPLGEKKHSFKPQALYETIRTEYARRQGVADDKLGLPVKASQAGKYLYERSYYYVFFPCNIKHVLKKVD